MWMESLVDESSLRCWAGPREVAGRQVCQTVAFPRGLSTGVQK